MSVQGSGVGKAVMAAALVHKFHKAIGIEQLKRISKDAEQLKQGAYFISVSHILASPLFEVLRTLTVQMGWGNCTVSSSSSNGSKSIQIEGASRDESSLQYDNDDILDYDDDNHYDPGGRPLTPQSKQSPRAPLNLYNQTKRLPAYPLDRLSHQSIEFIKVYCSPKRQPQSPKIQPQRDPPASRSSSSPVRRTDVNNFLHDDDVSPMKRPEVRGDVVPVLQSFFARPKPTKGRTKHYAHTVDKMIHRQEQYKRDLARHDQLRASAAALSCETNNMDDDDTVVCRREALRTHARSLKRQRMADLAAAKAVLHARDEMDRRCFQDTRESWEGAFEADVAELAVAFAKASHHNDSRHRRPMTTAGLVVPQAQSQVERDKVLLQLRAQTAPTTPQTLPSAYNPSRAPSPVMEGVLPGGDDDESTSKLHPLEAPSGYDWLDRSQSVEAAEKATSGLSDSDMLVASMLSENDAHDDASSRADTVSGVCGHPSPSDKSTL
ncbi:hypothetical protein DYB25_002542 [Aphanomyces astaci]|uniref:Uncharacterized protein n=1 Tax=Aphanomyces astaci TaxID=112090 RepID=A0A397AZN2_APHAT|nr:hypothetical protein DYB25_002542 [Aphanomyces astaci]